jgi:CysZ protein
MEALIVSTFRAIRSLATPGMLGVFVFSIILTVVMLMGFVGIATSFFIWFAAQMHGSSLSAFMPWIGGVGAGLFAWCLFPGIMPIIISFFDDKIARVIEGYDYPDMKQPEKRSFWPEFLHDVRFAVMALLLNIVVLPLYLLPGVNLVLFYVLNGYLLGREFFVMAARRHMPLAEAEALRKRHSRSVLAAGIMLTLLATIPLINLLAPFWGVAVMVHLYHSKRGDAKVEVLPPNHFSV